MSGPSGRDLVELSLSLIENVPWLMASTAKMSIAEIRSLLQKTNGLVVDTTDPISRVTGFTVPPSNAVVSLVASKAGVATSSVKVASGQMMASIPLLGSLSGMNQGIIRTQEVVDAIKFTGNEPGSTVEWAIVLRALEHSQRMSRFYSQVLQPLIALHQWPEDKIVDTSEGPPKRLYSSFAGWLAMVSQLRDIAHKQKMDVLVQSAMDCQRLDSRRSRLGQKLRELAEDLAEASVIVQLSRMFSAEAQSALIRFAQIAGKARFSKSTQVRVPCVSFLFLPLY